MENSQNLILHSVKTTEEKNNLGELNDLKKTLEEEGMQKVSELYKTGDELNIDKLKNIMKSGADEFEKKTGRKMTYIEMRELYG
jgi:hypothetical protein